MTKPYLYGRRILASLMILLQIAFFPSAALAQTAPADDTTTTTTTQTTDPSLPETPTVPTTPEVVNPTTASQEPATDLTIYGPAKPNGAAGNTFHYNPTTGLWENEHFVWDQKTQTTKPKQAPVYTYNAATGLWEGVEWMWDAPSNSYKPYVVTLAYNPNPPTTSRISNTGQASNNTINSSSTTNGTFNHYNTSGITNFITATAATGNALVQANTNAGSALSGNASDIANILNLLQSSWSPYGKETSTFVLDIDGNVVGDLMIDTTGAGSNNNINATDERNLTTNISNDSSINNNIDLDARSGDATVDSNTNAGSATSGNAHAVANVVNVMNSMVDTGESFIGTININGDYEGDILLPPDMISYLIAHSGPNSTNNVNSDDDSTLNVSLSDTETINNTVNATATSGDATLSGNTNAGSAKTGSADTNVTILNLTGSEIIGDNAILVFVNVHGKWVGAIVNTPEGSTAAGLANTGASSTNNVNRNTSTNETLNYDNNSTINNDINVNATSGNASVTNNTTAGDATSGNATAAVNIANISGSNLKLKKWFGILFINVFGSWKGSFGVNTAYGNQPSGGMGGEGTAPATTAAATTPRRTFSFIPRGDTTTSDEPASSATPSVLAAENSQPQQKQESSSQPTVATTAANAQANFWWAVGGITFALALLGAERFLTYRKR